MSNQPSDPFYLSRFVEAQEASYQQARSASGNEKGIVVVRAFFRM